MEKWFKWNSIKLHKHRSNPFELRWPVCYDPKLILDIGYVYIYNSSINLALLGIFSWMVSTNNSTSLDSVFTHHYVCLRTERHQRSSVGLTERWMSWSQAVNFGWESLVLYVNSLSTSFWFSKCFACIQISKIYCPSWLSTEPYDLVNISGSRWDGQYFH